MSLLHMPQVGTLLGLALALLFHPWTWKVAVPSYGLYVLGAVIVIVLNKVWFLLLPMWPHQHRSPQRSWPATVRSRRLVGCHRY